MRVRYYGTYTQCTQRMGPHESSLDRTSVFRSALMTVRRVENGGWQQRSERSLWCAVSPTQKQVRSAPQVTHSIMEPAVATEDHVVNPCLCAATYTPTPRHSMCARMMHC